MEKLNPQADEEENLVTRRTRLMNAEKIVTALGQVYQSLSDEESGGLKILGKALSQLERIRDLAGDDLDSVTDQLSETLTSLSDVTATLEQIQEKWGDVSELPAIDDRLFALRDMARKHQVSISELPDLLGKFKKDLTQLELGEDSLVTLSKQEGQARLDYIAKAEELSKMRSAAAIRLDTAVEAELPALKLGKATFKTDIQKLDETDWTENGLDKVSFLVSTNKGMPLSPIHKIASGGELARFMLALKVNLSAADEIETLVFDEVDSGVGGSVADAVGARLKRLAKNHQVLVVTHSPQVAAYGQAHFKVEKTETPDGVLTSVSVLTGDTRQDEIARMLSGEKITKTAHTMAGELLDTCSKK